jgi:threonine/homoserine/homoserine lactone efflux protein
MKIFKNILVGFLVSFVGSIPLGYLNIVGFEIYIKSGLKSTIPYLFGVIAVEFWVIYFTLLFANQLIKNKKLIRFIEGFSVVFMFILAYIFYSSSKSENVNSSIFSDYINSPFWLGIILSSANFIQVPFWTSWNLYLLNGNYIEISKSKKYFYVLGTISGTFIGMLILILSLSYITNQTDFLAKYLMKVIIPAVFIALGIYQGIKFYRKYSVQAFN